MTDQQRGWAFVGAQAILLIALIVMPGGDDWARGSALRLTANALAVVGFVVMGLAALGLGRALTATPIPKPGSGLRTDGLYRFVRHPIYSGLLLVVAGITLRSGNLATVAIAAVTVVFFNLKARWEEARLIERFPDYPTYAAATPRFIPRPWRLHRS